MRSIEVRILRGSATEPSHFQQYDVIVEDDAVVSVMNLLNTIYETQDHSIAFFSHAACKQAACGRCLVRINGKLGLACKEKVDFDTVTLEPCNSKVIRDLLCEL